jgi:hypothetical protein
MINLESELARLLTPKERAQSTRHQDLAQKAFETLKDAEKWKPLYFAYFKRAGGIVDLWELVETARGKDAPGRYFLAAARKRLGISK